MFASRRRGSLIVYIQGVMVKKLIGKLGLVIAVVLMLAVVGLAFVAGGALHPVKAASQQQWDYAMLVYDSDDGSIQWVDADPDRTKIMQSALEGVTKDMSDKKIPYIYYAQMVGRLGWELALERDASTITALTFKRPLSE